MLWAIDNDENVRNTLNRPRKYMSILYLGEFLGLRSFQVAFKRAWRSKSSSFAGSTRRRKPLGEKRAQASALHARMWRMSAVIPNSPSDVRAALEPGCSGRSAER
jgi:hypothetical protein